MCISDSSSCGIVQKLFYGVGLASAVFCASTAFSDGVPLDEIMTTNANGWECIPNAEFSVPGVTMDMTEENLLANLGQPLRREPYNPISDIPYDEELIYDGLRVTIWRGVVDEFSAANLRWKTPSGLYVGMSKHALFDALGGSPKDVIAHHQGGTLFHIPGCDQLIGIGWYLRFHIGDNDEVREILFTRDYP